jgi:hypothetical protein
MKPLVPSVEGKPGLALDLSSLPHTLRPPEAVLALLSQSSAVFSEVLLLLTACPPGGQVDPTARQQASVPTDDYLTSPMCHKGHFRRSDNIVTVLCNPLPNVGRRSSSRSPVLRLTHMAACLLEVDGPRWVRLQV